MIITLNYIFAFMIYTKKDKKLQSQTIFEIALRVVYFTRSFAKSKIEAVYITVMCVNI